MSDDQKSGRRYCIRRDGCGDKWCKKDQPGGCVSEYVEADYRPEHRYIGPDWPPPRRWVGRDGSIVYRTYSDYCD